jgi:hypothetical protein
VYKDDLGNDACIAVIKIGRVPQARNEYTSSGHGFRDLHVMLE